MALMIVMNGFYCLLKADYDKQADRDGSDVDEEIFPGVSGGVGGCTSSIARLRRVATACGWTAVPVQNVGD